MNSECESLLAKVIEVSKSESGKKVLCCVTERREKTWRRLPFFIPSSKGSDLDTSANDLKLKCPSFLPALVHPAILFRRWPQSNCRNTRP